MEDFGIHVNDELNQPDNQGMVRINMWEAENPIYLSPELTAFAKPHQIGGIRFMMEMLVKQGSGGILAHAMGLGKTFQVIALVDTIFRSVVPSYDLDLQPCRVLIVMPVSTLDNWMQEFDRFVPAPRPYMLYCLKKSDQNDIEQV